MRFVINHSKCQAMLCIVIRAINLWTEICFKSQKSRTILCFHFNNLPDEKMKQTFIVEKDDEKLRS